MHAQYAENIGDDQSHKTEQPAQTDSSGGQQRRKSHTGESVCLHRKPECSRSLVSERKKVQTAGKEECCHTADSCNDSREQKLSNGNILKTAQTEGDFIRHGLREECHDHIDSGSHKGRYRHAGKNDPGL